MVPLGGLYLGSSKAIPKRNHYGACGYLYSRMNGFYIWICDYDLGKYPPPKTCTYEPLGKGRGASYSRVALFLFAYLPKEPPTL